MSEQPDNAKRARVLQLNVARSNIRTHAMLNTLKDTDIILIQDPWWGRIGTERSTSSRDSVIYGTVASPSWHCFIPTSPNSPAGPGVAIYYRKGRDWLDGTIFTDYPPSHSLLAVDFNIYGQQVCITNIYFHGTHAKDGLDTLLNNPADISKPGICAGDFTLHHKLWALEGGVPPSQTGPASDLAEWILMNDFAIFNRPNIPTCRGNGRQRDSVIDLTLVNPSAFEMDLVSDWECDQAWSFGSDHNGISWNITIPSETAFEPPEQTDRYIIDSTRHKEWLSAFGDFMGANPLPDKYITHEDCEQGARTLLEAMTSATRATMPRAKPNRKGPRAEWWSEECSLTVQSLANAPDAMKDTFLAELRRAIRTARRAHADKVCREIEISEVWRLTTWSSGKRATKMPPLRFENGFATNPEDQAKVFRDTFFPQNPPDVNLADGLGVPLEATRGHHPITKNEVASALASSSNKSAPGAFGSNYRVLKWANEYGSGPLVSLYNGCLDLGFHPSCLRNAIVSVIPKPRKMDMSNPSSYRPISLLETLSKCLEKIIASRILYEVGKYNLILFSQFGGRDYSLCTDAGLAMVYDIHTTWSHSEKASLLTLDIKGYFNNVNHARLLATLSHLGFSRPICSWLGSYLSDRTVQFRIDSVLCAPISIAPVGIPQGSPLSPVLSSIYSLPVLLSLNAHPNVTIKGYVDNFTLLATGPSYDANIITLELAVECASHRLAELGLSFELDKCNLIHFAAQKRDCATNPDIDLGGPNGTARIVRAQPVIRWLGFFLDRRLDFKDHVKKMATKALSIIAGLRLLANSVRGLAVRHARFLYKTCVMPVLTYGAILWYTGSRQKSLMAPLIRAQNTGLRWLLGAFRTSPVGAMEHVASILPIPLALQRLAENAATQLRRLPPASQIAKRLPATWDTHDQSLPQPNPSSPQQPVIHRIAELSHPEAEHTIPYLVVPWHHPHPWSTQLSVSFPSPNASEDERQAYVKQARSRIHSAESDGSIVCFTDRSRCVVRGCRKVGAGFCVVHRGREINTGIRGLGPRADIFDAEMMALAIAAKRAESLALTLTAPKIVFFTDNIAAAQKICDLRPHPAQSSSIIFRDSVDKILTNTHNSSVEIRWIPSHKGIPGNKQADSLAAEACNINPTPLFNRSITWAREMAKAKAVRVWTNTWRSSKKSALVSSHLPYNPRWKLHPFHDSFTGEKAIHSHLIQVILGHGFFGQYYVWFVPSEDPSCQCDHDTFQSASHIIVECPLHNAARMVLRKASRPLLISDLFGSLKGLQAMATFLSRSSAFTKRS